MYQYTLVSQPHDSVRQYTTMHNDIVNPPRAHGLPLFRATVKQTAADFRVDESLTIAFSGNGEHLYLQIEKTAMNTDEVVSQLQRIYTVQSADIGLCGLKDRHSVSTQWFSVKTPSSAEPFEAAAMLFNEQQVAGWQNEGDYIKQIRLICHERHARKLRRGAHGGNRFNIVLRDVKVDAIHSGVTPAKLSLAEAVGQRLSFVEEKGFPAFIGAQRFGQGGQNLQRARQWFAKPRKRITRQQRSLYLSAARSALFNRVLSARVADGSWDQLLSGEPVVLNGSRSFFTQDANTQSDDVRTAAAPLSKEQYTEEQLPESLQLRLQTFDIHPSAPWWGRGQTPATGDCAVYETQLLGDYRELCDALERAGFTQERRAIRAQALELEHRWQQADDVLELQFFLGPGMFATTLLRELATLTEPNR